MRIAFIVSHPIQYYVPIYRSLTERICQADERLKDEERERLRDQGIKRQPSAAQRRETGRPCDQRDEKTKRLRDARAKELQTDDGILAADDPARISALKVFYTWRDAGVALDHQFGKKFAWDIPLMDGYDFEVVPNTSADPGTHHRRGLINPDLVERVKAWQPDAVHITGYNYVSHGLAIKALSQAGIPVIFRGDSHLLDDLGPWWKWWLKKSWLSKVYRWPQGFAYVGQANRDYYRAFGVPERKLFHVPHTIDVGRFAEPNDELETKASAWRRELGIPDDHFVFLYAAKLEPRKRPMELLEAFLAADIPKTTLLFVGSGELEEALRARVNTGHGWGKMDADRVRAAAPTGLKGNAHAGGPPALAVGPLEEAEKFQRTTGNSAHRVVFVPFQNQSQMPVVYRLGDALVLPSGYGETWGLAVNEAQACGRPSLVSDRVGCARDIVREGENGSIFRAGDEEDLVAALRRIAAIDSKARRSAIRQGAAAFDTKRGADALIRVLEKVTTSQPNR